MKNKGFTLIEVALVIAIIGILASVVLPAAVDYKSKAHVVSDKMEERQQKLEEIVKEESKTTGFFNNVHY
jgi:prepilin-type N-terminal cleavage/methylation domain-containing protein